MRSKIVRRLPSWQRSGVVSQQRLRLRRLTLVKRIPKLRFESVSFLFLACFSEAFPTYRILALEVWCKNWKRQNTVFGYKKWSNPESDEWKSSATPNMWWVSFIRILIRWAEHTSRGGGNGLPPPQLDSCQFEGLCLRTNHSSISRLSEWNHEWSSVMRGMVNSKQTKT